MKLQPLGDRVLVLVDSVEAKTESGLFIPEMAQQKIASKVQTGIIVEIGTEPGYEGLEIGLKVMYDQHAGTKLQVGGKDHLLVRVLDLLAIVG